MAGGLLVKRIISSRSFHIWAANIAHPGAVATRSLEEREGPPEEHREGTLVRKEAGTATPPWNFHFPLLSWAGGREGRRGWSVRRGEDHCWGCWRRKRRLLGTGAPDWASRLFREVGVCTAHPKMGVPSISSVRERKGKWAPGHKASPSPKKAHS